jgi:hypothetical protein
MASEMESRALASSGISRGQRDAGDYPDDNRVPRDVRDARDRGTRGGRHDIPSRDSRDDKEATYIAHQRHTAFVRDFGLCNYDYDKMWVIPRFPRHTCSSCPTLLMLRRTMGYVPGNSYAHGYGPPGIRGVARPLPPDLRQMRRTTMPPAYAQPTPSPPSPRLPEDVLGRQYTDAERRGSAHMETMWGGAREYGRSVSYGRPIVAPRAQRPVVLSPNFEGYEGRA